MLYLQCAIEVLRNRYCVLSYEFPPATLPLALPEDMAVHPDEAETQVVDTQLFERLTAPYRMRLVAVMLNIWKPRLARCHRDANDTNAYLYKDIGMWAPSAFSQ